MVSKKDDSHCLFLHRVDTKGPEIRTGPLPENKEVIDIPTGARICLTTHDVTQESASDPMNLKLQVDYQSIAKTVKIGKEVLLDDGLIALEVVAIENEKVVCTALNGGPIKKNKGVNLPGMQIDLPALTDKDKGDLKWACEVGADFVAASFIRTAGNVRSVVAFLDRCTSALPSLPNGTRPLRPLVISKIENKEGVDNFDDILTESDGIMVSYALCWMWWCKLDDGQRWIDVDGFFRQTTTYLHQHAFFLT
jgi:pyruvate kinase